MKDPTGLGKARPTGATPDDLSHPHATIGIINRPEPGSHALHQAACKIEANRPTPISSRRQHSIRGVSRAYFLPDRSRTDNGRKQICTAIQSI